MLIPTFERASFIARALESRFAQSHESREFAIVDDGSRGTAPA